MAYQIDHIDEKIILRLYTKGAQRISDFRYGEGLNQKPVANHLEKLVEEEIIWKYQSMKETTKGAERQSHVSFNLTDKGREIGRDLWDKTGKRLEVSFPFFDSKQRRVREAGMVSSVAMNMGGGGSFPLACPINRPKVDPELLAEVEKLTIREMPKGMETIERFETSDIAAVNVAWETQHRKKSSANLATVAVPAQKRTITPENGVEES